MSKEEYEANKRDLADARGELEELMKMGANDERIVDTIRILERNIRAYELRQMEDGSTGA